MKRRFESESRHQPNVNRSSSGGFARRRGSDNRFVSKVKRARPATIGKDPLSTNILDDSSTRYEESRGPRSGIPKTSEFAFFKKVKETAIQRDRHSLEKASEQTLKDIRHYYPDIRLKEKGKMKNSKANDYVEAFSNYNALNRHSKGIKLSSKAEKASHNNHSLFASPVEGRYKSPGEACPVDPKCSSFTIPMNVSTLDKSLQLSPQTAPKFSDTNSWSEVFSAKRQKLRQWTDMALASSENFSSKGSDIITMLLSRLSPVSHENKGSKFTGSTVSSTLLPEPDPSETRGYQSYRRDLSEPDYGTYQSNELSSWPVETRGCQSYRRDLSEPDYGTYQSNELSSWPVETRGCQSYRRDLSEPDYGTCQSNELSSWPVGMREIIPMDWPAFASDTHFNRYRAETVSCNVMEDHDYGLKSDTTKGLLKQIGTPAHLLFGQSGFTDLYRFKEVDSFCCPYESPRRKPQTLLLSWDFNQEIKEPKVDITANSYELQEADFQKCIDTRHNTMALCSPSLYFDHFSHFRMLPDIHSTSLQEDMYSANFRSRDFGRNLECKEYVVEEPDQLSPFYDSEYIDPEYNSDILHFQEYPRGRPVQVFSEKRHLDSNAFLLPMAPRDSERNFLLTSGYPSSNHSTQHPSRSAYSIQLEKEWNIGSSNSEAITILEEPFNSHKHPYCNFRTSVDRMLGCPLLLTDTSWARSKAETYINYSDEWKHS